MGLKMKCQIDWKTRFKNKIWLTGFIAQILLLVQLVAVFLNTNFGLNIKFTDEMIKEVMAIVDVILVILAGLGIVVDPTTPGIGDDNEEVDENV